jgi:DNA-binding response OmpR family regulator
VKTRLLIADDDKNLRETLRCALEDAGFGVITASDGVAALSALASDAGLALIVLDISMPLMDGLELLRKLRASGDGRPVIVLTSRDDEFDRVLGLELGADDYLTKPFSLRELMARIRAVLRRSGACPGGPYAADARVLRSGPLVMDEERFSATWQGGELRLTITEFRMLWSLATHPLAVKTREQLLEAAFPEDAYQSDRSVDCHVKRLRRKFIQAGAAGEPIETIYGLGYRYSAAR